MALPKLTNRWAVLALLFSVRICMAANLQAVSPIVPFLVRDFGITYGQVGILIGVMTLPGGFLALPGGLLARRFGDKNLVLVGLLLMAAGAFVFAGTTGFAVALAGRLVSGLGLVLLNVQMAKIVTDWFVGREVATALGIHAAGLHLGFAVALGVLGKIAVTWSWQAAMSAAGAYTVLVAIALWALYAEPPEAGGPDARNQGPLWSIGRRELELVLAAGFMWMLVNAAITIVLSFTPSLLALRGVPVDRAALAVSLVPWLTLVTLPLYGLLVDRTGHKGPFIVGAALAAAVACALVPRAAPVLPLLVFGLVCGAGSGGIMSLPAEVLRPSSRNTGFGVFYTVFYGGIALMPPLAGVLQDATAHPGAPLWFAAALLVTVPVALLAFRRLQARGPTI
jgi:MFS family permease